MCRLCLGIRELCVCQLEMCLMCLQLLWCLMRTCLFYITFDASMLDHLACLSTWSFCRGGQLVLLGGFAWGCFKAFKGKVISQEETCSCKAMLLVMKRHDIVCLLLSLLPPYTQFSGWFNKRIDTGIGVSDLPVPYVTVLHYRLWVWRSCVVSFEGTVVELKKVLYLGTRYTKTCYSKI